MSLHLVKDIENLKKRLLSLSVLVEESLRQAMEAVEKRDKNLALKVIGGDVNIDQIEVELEEECLKSLALYQPVAIDLRFIVAVLKINDNLERIGDLAVNIAERAAYLADRNEGNISFDFSEMADKTQTMLKESLDALINLDTALARRVCAADDEVDALNRKMYEQVEERIRKNPESSGICIHFLSISRYLERIADQSTNIAEDVIYMVEGKIIRHKTEECISQA